VKGSFPVRILKFAWAVEAGLIAACGPIPSEKPADVNGTQSKMPSPTFVEVAVQLGVDFVHLNGMSGGFYFVEALGAGAALFDYDGDGDLDLYLVQGHMLGEGKSVADYPLESPSGPPFRDRMFRNELADGGELRFTDVTAQSEIVAEGYGMGVAVADYDNDACPDLYVLNWGQNELWHNLCDGTFEEVGRAAGVDDSSWSVAATFLDFDRDGWLDLYVVNYKKYALANDPKCSNKLKQREYCGPIYFDSIPDHLYRNRKDGTFEDVSDSSLLGSTVGAGLGVVATDLDGDGWVDLYVANDQEGNFLWRNRRDGTLQEIASLTGTAVDRRGLALASMGVDAADFDSDGDTDLFLSHLDGEPSVLYQNLGNGLFEDVSVKTGLGEMTWSYTGFGTLFLDYDNDGLLDLFVANGAIETQPELRRLGAPFPLHQTNQLLHNLGPGHFEEATAQAGEAFALSEVSRGAASGDIDNDGDTDVVVVNNGGRVRVLENQVGSRNLWLGLRLVTGSPPRDVLGARVRVDRRGAATLWRQVRIDGSFASANDPRVLVGLGEATEVSGVVVEWPDGRKERFAAPPLRCYSLLHYGAGMPLEDAGSG
jgi:hypothetical protein